MELTLPERIQLLRKRIGMNQGQFGAKVFDTSIEAGRTKIKNIELGKQVPSEADLSRMAKVLDVPAAALLNIPPADSSAPATSLDGMRVDAAVLDRFDKLGPYLDMLNRAVSMKDEELIAHITEKLCDVFAGSGQLKAVND